jgi:hypothetical protein
VNQVSCIYTKPSFVSKFRNFLVYLWVLTCTVVLLLRMRYSHIKIACEDKCTVGLYWVQWLLRRKKAISFAANVSWNVTWKMLSLLWVLSKCNKEIAQYHVKNWVRKLDFLHNFWRRFFRNIPGYPVNSQCNQRATGLFYSIVKET